MKSLSVQILLSLCPKGSRLFLQVWTCTTRSSDCSKEYTVMKQLRGTLSSVTTADSTFCGTKFSLGWSAAHSIKLPGN